MIGNDEVKKQLNEILGFLKEILGDDLKGHLKPCTDLMVKRILEQAALIHHNDPSKVIKLAVEEEGIW